MRVTTVVLLGAAVAGCNAFVPAANVFHSQMGQPRSQAVCLSMKASPFPTIQQLEQLANDCVENHNCDVEKVEELVDAIAAKERDLEIQLNNVRTLRLELDRLLHLGKKGSYSPLESSEGDFSAPPTLRDWVTAAASIFKKFDEGNATPLGYSDQYSKIWPRKSDKGKKDAWDWDMSK